jgi:phosphoadenosine phosphosulfate reductase
MSDDAFLRLNALPPLDPQAPLDQKTARARAVLAACAQSPLRRACAFTGGKDSTVALRLWLDALAGRDETGAPLALSVDTGLKFPQVTAFRDRLCADWSVALTLARPQVDLAAYPVARDHVSCCRDLKIRPLGNALRETGVGLLITGLRRDEHPSRALRPYFEHREETEDMPAHWQANPVLDFTEMDVWAFLTGGGLPYCELYHEGYRSLGCMPCTRKAGAEGDERAGRAGEKERQLDVLKGLGYF